MPETNNQRSTTPEKNILRPNTELHTESLKCLAQILGSHEPCTKQEIELALGRLLEVENLLNEQKEENDFAFLQLHQLQEELEQYFLKSQDLSREKNKLTNANKVLHARLSETIMSYHENRKYWLISRGKLTNPVARALCKKLISITYEA